MTSATDPPTSSTRLPPPDRSTEQQANRRIQDFAGALAKALGISDQTIHTWRRQDRIDKGLEPGLTSGEQSELAVAKQRIAALEAELAVHRRASELLGKVVPPKGGSRPSR